MHPISFPNFNLTFNINPVAISIFGINIYWYGIIIVTAILIGLFLAKKDNGLHGIKYDDVVDFSIIAVFVGIIFARGYYVLFNLKYYIKNMNEIFKIWNGGLAIYGGIIGGVITCILFCKKKKIKILDMLDYLVPFLALGQAIGRWGNFINQEAYGGITQSFLKMRIYDKNTLSFIDVHPTFLYESLLDFAIFILLMKLRKKRRFQGQLVYIYFIIYGIGRAIIEGFRADSLMFCGFRVSQIFSLILVIFSTVMCIFGEKCRRKNA